MDINNSYNDYILKEPLTHTFSHWDYVYDCVITEIITCQSKYYILPSGDDYIIFYGNVKTIMWEDTFFNEKRENYKYIIKPIDKECFSMKVSYQKFDNLIATHYEKPMQISETLYNTLKEQCIKINKFQDLYRVNAKAIYNKFNNLHIMKNDKIF